MHFRLLCQKIKLLHKLMKQLPKHQQLKLQLNKLKLQPPRPLHKLKKLDHKLLMLLLPSNN
jgi:hypothetical protein